MGAAPAALASLQFLYDATGSGGSGGGVYSVMGGGVYCVTGGGVYAGAAGGVYSVVVLVVVSI
ncbi:hypothetical protein ACIBED_09395 [Rhodococcus coprophilus]|uniref:hypothetical protein n=1 Tax=Rhodococcus coprophilus TaxID=38310 RepID=UPI000AC4804C|nr:hypothetical protein [Rhodococcus coprophilus]MBM7459039.1 hypothetical protein [Rhodococcus coprophilus]